MRNCARAERRQLIDKRVRLANFRRKVDIAATLEDGAPLRAVLWLSRFSLEANSKPMGTMMPLPRAAAQRNARR